MLESSSITKYDLSENLPYFSCAKVMSRGSAEIGVSQLNAYSGSTKVVNLASEPSSAAPKLNTSLPSGFVKQANRRTASIATT